MYEMKKANKNLFTDHKEISFSRYLVLESDVKLKAVINKPGSKMLSRLIWLRPGSNGGLV